MLIFPAIDLIDGKAVRLHKGDYDKKTIFGDDPVQIAKDFAALGAKQVHLVDLDGAATGETPNLDLICRIKKESGLFCEVGGGVRSMETIRKYLDAGIDRVILGTAAVKDPELLKEAVKEYGERIAVGVDIKDRMVAIKGWMETTGLDVADFCSQMEDAGVKTVICTDISKDGAMEGTNRELYKELSEKFSFDIMASGGVSTIDDVRKLSEMGLYGAIIGKAYYIGAIDLKEAMEIAK